MSVRACARAHVLLSPPPQPAFRVHTIPLPVCAHTDSPLPPPPSRPCQPSCTPLTTDTCAEATGGGATGGASEARVLGAVKRAREMVAGLLRLVGKHSGHDRAAPPQPVLGYQHLRQPAASQSLATAPERRARLNLRGLLPAGVVPLDVQVDTAIEQVGGRLRPCRPSEHARTRWACACSRQQT